MKAAIGRLLHRWDPDEIEREVGAELELHLDLLTQDYLNDEMSLTDAKDAALKQFGNVDQIKEQCVEISRRRHPLVLGLKCLIIVVFMAGVLVRVLGTDFHVTRCGDLLITVSILSWVLLYARLNPLLFFSQSKRSSPLKLTDPKPFAVYDQKKRTPVERVISR